MIYEREQANNALMDTNVIKNKLEREVALKNERILELMALLKQYKSDL